MSPFTLYIITFSLHLQCTSAYSLTSHNFIFLNWTKEVRDLNSADADPRRCWWHCLTLLVSQNLSNRYHSSFSILSFSYLLHPTSIIIIAGIIDISTKILLERKFHTIRYDMTIYYDTHHEIIVIERFLCFFFFFVSYLFCLTSMLLSFYFKRLFRTVSFLRSPNNHDFHTIRR